MSVFIGVDVGLNGAIAVIEPYGDRISLHDIPVIKTEKQVTKKKIKKIRRYDIEEMVRIVRGIKRVWDAHPRHWFLEDVHSLPMFASCPENSLDRALGIWEGILHGTKEKFLLVKPRDWKKEFDLLKTEKDASRLKAIELFPNLKTELSRKKDVDRADALLITCYGKRKYNDIKGV